MPILVPSRSQRFHTTTYRSVANFPAVSPGVTTRHGALAVNTTLPLIGSQFPTVRFRRVFQRVLRIGMILSALPGPHVSTHITTCFPTVSVARSVPTRDIRTTTASLYV
eukprot:gb/GEZN01022508.1/.p3 GENE.gb/GEZN01022508.1/~~gb/GEZN01022508.1/.p3  ORF type:complete len:109 (+),score=1.82 gb/GEZN01022508.1/:124-450(+)